MFKTLISREQIATRVKELGQEIHKKFPEGPILCIGILRGSFIFMADLIREIPRNIHCEFITASSYHNSLQSSGTVEINSCTSTLTESILDQNILLIEDIIDTGRTIKYLTGYCHNKKAKSIWTCSLLYKKRENANIEKPNFIGFEIPDVFVMGYGLDIAQQFRNLPYIAKLEDSINLLQ